jgi:hypothetical protein
VTVQPTCSDGEDRITVGPWGLMSGARNASISRMGISLSVFFLLPPQPVDADQSFHLSEFGVPGDHGGFLLDGGGYGKAVGIGKGVLPLDFCRLDDILEGVVGPVQGQTGKDGIQRAKESNTFLVFTIHFLLTVLEQALGEGRSTSDKISLSSWFDVERISISSCPMRLKRPIN